jgi:uncharacterized SAM-binding protein YcdF (DUF218 family)
MKIKSKYIWGAVGALVAAAVFSAFLFRNTILFKAGSFMAPESNQIEGITDVVILEGTEFISRSAISMGLKLLSSGKARRMVIVLHAIAPNHRPFAFNEDYPSSVRNELKNLGVKDSTFTIIVTHIANPVTLVSAKSVLEMLSKEGVKTAILISPGFHMRRSFLVYQYLSIPLKIKIYPIACFEAYQLNNWWNQDQGPRDFLSEFQKLVYYIIEGYIPLKFSY